MAENDLKVIVKACENIDDLHRVMETINRNQYQLISVTQDSRDIYTVFFRRCLVG